jgi:hypothetical protein
MHDNDKIIKFPGGSPRQGAIVLRLELLLVPLPVWRRIMIGADCTFWDLHVAIQDAMGWEDKHLHRFTVDDPRTAERLHFGIPDASGFHGSERIEPGWEHRVTRYLVTDGLPMLYTYDFGDFWQHEVLREPAHDIAADQSLPTILAGEGACPREDCGGPAGWSDLLKSGLAAEFDPADIEFQDPVQRWRHIFGPAD